MNNTNTNSNNNINEPFELDNTIYNSTPIQTQTLTNTGVKLDNDTDSDSDEYVDLSLNINLESESIYQFVINENKLELKHVGRFTKAPDIIIKEKFGPESNMSLYSCVYTLNELTTKSDELFFPLVKLVVQTMSNVIITCISIKLTSSIEPDNLVNNLVSNLINEWELYWLENKSDSEHIKMCKIEKNINPSNIIEKLVGYSVNN